jgi:glyoxylase-like metal-dependent hydrolase (beta-lactamase superfamily II)
MSSQAQPAITFPYPEAPEPGVARPVAPGVLWLRFSLPFLLNHVNAYLVEDEGGWAALDTGLGTDITKAAWDKVFAGPLHGQRLTRVICSHYHPDHMGLVGWLTGRFDCPLHVTRTEFLTAKVLETSDFAANPQFYLDRGLPIESSTDVSSDGHGYLRLVTGLPLQFERLMAGRTLRIGGRVFEVFTGGGHSPEQAMLYCASENLFFSFDQVLCRISPNISVQAMEPAANPLGDYLGSLAEIRREIPDDVLVLPGHHVPFTGLHARVRELQDHHATRCGLIAAAASVEPRTAADLLPVLFKRQMDAHQTGFAFAETVAHINLMVARRELVQQRGADGVLRVRAA